MRNLCLQPRIHLTTKFLINHVRFISLSLFLFSFVFLFPKIAPTSIGYVLCQNLRNRRSSSFDILHTFNKCQWTLWERLSLPPLVSQPTFKFVSLTLHKHTFKRTNKRCLLLVPFKDFLPLYFPSFFEQTCPFRLFEVQRTSTLKVW